LKKFGYLTRFPDFPIPKNEALPIGFWPMLQSDASRGDGV